MYLRNLIFKKTNGVKCPVFIMKIILIIMCGLFGVAQAQTTGYFRYDTTRFQKGGGNNEVYIENGTKALTGGVFTNMGNGLGRWVTPAAVSSDWKLTGNAGTTAGTNFIGTTDSIDFVGKTKGLERFRWNARGALGLGTGTDYGTAGWLLKTNGATTAPTWVNPVSIYPTWQKTLDVSAILDKTNAIDGTTVDAENLYFGKNTRFGAIQMWANLLELYGVNTLINGTNAVMLVATDSIAFLSNRIRIRDTSRNNYLNGYVFTLVDKTTGEGTWKPASGGGSLAVGTTPIGSGASGNPLYNNAGVLGEYTTTGTGTVLMKSVSPTTTGTFTGAAADFSGNVNISSAGNKYLFINPTGASDQAAVLYQKNGVVKWQFGMDFAASGAADFYVYDQANSKAKIYSNTSGTLNLGADAYASPAMIILDNGSVGIGVTPTAKLHIAAGTATASTAPLKFTAGTNLTTPEAGAVEFDGTNYWVTISSTRTLLTRTITGTAAPATTPAAIGMQFLDTANKKLYVATGTSSSADWTILN